MKPKIKNVKGWRKIVAIVLFPALWIYGIVNDEKLWKNHARKIQEKLDKEHYDEQVNWIRK